MTTWSKAIPVLVILSTLWIGPLVLAQVQIPQERQSDQLVKTRSMEQPQLSQYAVELPAGNPLTMVPVRGNVYMLAGGSANIAVQVGTQGAFLVDAATEETSDWVLQAIEVVSRGQIQYITMTSADPEHYRGNEVLGNAGRNPTRVVENPGGPVENTLAPNGGQAAGGGRGGRGGRVRVAQQEGAIIFGHENAYNRLAAPGSAETAPFALWPTSTFFTQKKTLSYNGEPIELIHVPNALTDGDVMVFFRGSDVVATGDVIDTEGYPRIDRQRGGTIQGLLDALNDVVEITVPEYNQQGGTKVIPGHGRIYQEHDAVNYRDMMTIIRDRVALGIQQGMSLADIKAQRPTLDYDGLYSKPDWTGDMLVEVIHADLVATGYQYQR